MQKTEVRLGVQDAKTISESKDAELVGLSNEEILQALEDEWKLVEELRRGCLLDLLQVCKIMHKVRQTLAKDMLQVLVENKWREDEVSKELGKASVAIMKAMKGLERNKTPDRVLEREEDECGFFGVVPPGLQGNPDGDGELLLRDDG